MPIYTGKSADGSDMKEVEGVYVNPDNPDEWSSDMYPSQAKLHRLYVTVWDYMNDNRLIIDDVYAQIKAKTCPLSKRERDYVLSHYDENGKLID
jgi:hypothetical protein